jgi:cobaltochelatase CobS
LTQIQQWRFWRAFRTIAASWCKGYHGTGKSTHIEQVAARLNWPSVRVNLDSHISRIDLIGKDAIKLKDGKQVTEFHEGILPWALRNPVAIVFDEYDAGVRT